MVRRVRLDTELVRRGLARSREQAADLIAAGRVAVGGQTAAKVATQVGQDAAITIAQASAEPDYASRGGRKLEGALAAFAGLSVTGRRCLDAGASTGGFTDVLLRAGAAQVVAVDVGYGQLAWALRTDPRVTVLDRVNVRQLTPEQVAPAPSLVTADLSFISLSLVLPALAACAAPDADFVLLVKPQFEVGKGNVGAGGVVRSPAKRAEAVRSVAARGGRARPGGAGSHGEPAPRAVRERGVFPVAAPRGAAAGRGCRGAGDHGRTTVKSERTMLVVAHTGRPAGVRVARLVVHRLSAAGVAVRVLEPEAADLGPGPAEVVPASSQAASGTEMVLVIGGDGTLLRAAELARPAGVPLLGVNLGHVGFLAEAEPENLPEAVDRVVEGKYLIEQRMTIDVTVRENGDVTATTWALNEASVEKTARERVLDMVVEVDGRPLSRWGCDGVVFATPTGSTAYAFSAGGPVVWPEVEAMLMVPISAHALFARPMVVSPCSVLATEVIGPAAGQGETSRAVLWCDGRRRVDLNPGARVEARRGTEPVLLARLGGIGVDTEGAEVGAPFTDRLVVKFGLPVAGWRGRGDARSEEHGGSADAAAARQRDEEPGGNA